MNDLQGEIKEEFMRKKIQKGKISSISHLKK